MKVVSVIDTGLRKDYLTTRISIPSSSSMDNPINGAPSIRNRVNDTSCGLTVGI